MWRVGSSWSAQRRALGSRLRLSKHIGLSEHLVEDTDDWFAQDAQGNVWYLGEDTRELEDGQVVSTEGSWQAGVDNARAGIFLPAEPQLGQAFKQEDAKNVAEDCTKIVDLNASVKTPFVSSNEALKTEEFSLLEPACSTTSTTSAASAWSASRPSRAGATYSSSSRSNGPERIRRRDVFRSRRVYVSERAHRSRLEQP
jgi:hypothetical protein